MKEFRQQLWDDEVRAAWQQILTLAVREDVDRVHDWTTVSLVPERATGAALVVAREPGVVAGLPAAEMTVAEYDRTVEWSTLVEDGAWVERGTAIASLAGPARSLLTAERVLLNVLGRLSGIATLTRRFVEAVAGTKARIYDTRKTTPGWRLLEKYAVHCGGGHNHRSGLYDAVLIKDNHLALGASLGGERFTPAQAVVRTRQFLDKLLGPERAAAMIVEVEVDTLEQLAEILPAAPDIVLLDNMPPAMLREAVTRRDRDAPQVELEASGGINWETIRGIAESGVDRISLGALTHSARAWDVGLDWNVPA
ncbi:MAG: carboxylating nicotinate-nucleotide diphosphorylase [Pirellulales bacterium]|nr:carboxylating nicotinate-nucleotide diphosphorylase [Pirellulales bacterium]